MKEPSREEIPCNLCKSTETRLWAQVGPATVVQCIPCGLVYTNPRPVRQVLDTSYEEEYTEVHQDPQLLRQRQAMYRIEKEAIMRRVQGGRFLDVGCGTGEFLSLLPREFEPYGVDVSRVSIRHAREHFGLEHVFAGSLDDVAFDDDFFDVIQFRGVLQHLPDPLDAVLHALRIMRPGGLLVVSATPNISSVCARIFRERFRLLAPDHMVFNFSPHTLRAMLEKAGFRVERFHFPYFATPYFHPRQLWDFVRLSTTVAFERVTGRKRADIVSPPFFGNMMCCYALKPAELSGGGSTTT